MRHSLNLSLLTPNNANFYTLDAFINEDHVIKLKQSISGYVNIDNKGDIINTQLAHHYIVSRRVFVYKYFIIKTQCNQEMYVCCWCPHIMGCCNFGVFLQHVENHFIVNSDVLPNVQSDYDIVVPFLLL